MRWVVLCACGVALAGCALVPEWAGGPGQVDPAAEQVTVEDVTPADEEIADVTPEPDPPVAPEPEAEVSIGTLGRTVASLGNAAEPGLWLKTPLVSTEQPGRVYYPDTNTTVDVTLIPIEGPATAGSRLSLAAMQALGAPLTGLPEVDVFAG